MNIEIDLAEVAALAKDRNVSLRCVLLDYLDEYLSLNPKFLYDVEAALGEDLAFRCIECGYWLEPGEERATNGITCTQCYEERISA